jgi:hypothetical protein
MSLGQVGDESAYTPHRTMGIRQIELTMGVLDSGIGLIANGILAGIPQRTIITVPDESPFSEVHCRFGLRLNSTLADQLHPVRRSQYGGISWRKSERNRNGPCES